MATGHDIAMGLRAAYRALHRQTDMWCAQRGVTADQFVLLVLLGEEDGITQQGLVRRASSDANTVRAMLVLLEKRGLVARERHPIDGRAHSVTLTRQGRQTLERLWTVSDPLRKRLADALQPEEADTLVQLLGRLCEALAQKKRQTRSGSKVSATSGR